MFCPKCGTDNLDTNKFCRKCGKNLPSRAQIPQAVPHGFGVQHSPGFVGQTLDGKYRIDAKLGSGGMGDVYRATRLLIGDTVAVKILHPHLARDPQAAERFRREAVMATKLRHRNVVGIYDVGISAAFNVPYILMEMAEGYTLRQIISQYRVLPLDFAVTVTTQVCSALDEAHGLGIVHRDIKPENIVANQTTTGWYIKVLDFGIAKLYNQGDIGLTLDGNAMGTPQYMSPEQCLGESLDARSDIYSVGIMLYEMLTGTVPFKSPTASAIAIHQVQTAPSPPRSMNAEIHPDVEAVVLRSLAKQPELRPQKASLLAQELIKAATSAFKSGFTAVPAAPIPAPDVVPEFDASAVEEPTEPEIQDPPVLEGITPLTIEKKGKRSKSRKKSEGPDGEPQPTESLVEPSDSITPIAIPESPLLTVDETEVEDLTNYESPTEVVSNDGLATDVFEGSTEARVPVGESVVSDPPDEDLEEVMEIVPSIPENAPEAGVASSETADAEGLRIGSKENELYLPEIEGSENIDDDLSKVFEDAEIRLDEILLDEEHAGAMVVEKGSNEPPNAEELTLHDDPGEREDDFAVEQQGSDQILSFENYAGMTGFKSKWLILVVSGVAMLLIAIAAVGYFLSGSGTPASQSNENTVLKQEPNGPQPGMALVPGGEFMMGSDVGDENSRPAHKVIVRPFYMDITEVTNEDYKKFVDATKHKPPADWKNGTFPVGKSRFPVTNVDWDDASAYAKWAGKRLPSEEEWEFAARGTDGRVYPWGMNWKAEYPNANNQTIGMREVGQGDGKSPFGMLDMVGNAWEWTASDAAAYPGGKLITQVSGRNKVIRGGCFLSLPNQATAIIRVGWPPRGGNEYENTGFRCAKDPATNSP